MEGLDREMKAHVYWQQVRRVESGMKPDISEGEIKSEGFGLPSQIIRLEMDFKEASDLLKTIRVTLPQLGKVRKEGLRAQRLIKQLRNIEKAFEMPKGRIKRKGEKAVKGIRKNVSK